MFLGKDITNALIKPPIFQAERSYVATATALTGNGIITNYDVVRVDNYNAFSSGVYTIPVDGLYYFMFFISENSASLGDIYMRRNGATIGFNLVTRHLSKWNGASTCTTYPCVVGDQIDCYLNYTTSRTNTCRYQFGGFMKRGSQ